MSNMVLHCGAWEATPAQIEAVVVPDATDTYQPVAYMDLVQNVRKAAKLFDLDEKSSRFALNRDGAQMFGLLNYGPTNGNDDIGLSVALRNSYDNSLSVGIAAGSQVFVCDNLALSGEWQKTRKHTKNAWEDLYAFLYGAFPSLLTKHRVFLQAAERWRNVPLGRADADHMIVEACRRGALPPADVMPILKEYTEPTIEAWKDESRNAWRLYNAATQIAKKWSPILQLARTRKLTDTFHDVLKTA